MEIEIIFRFFLRVPKGMLTLQIVSHEELGKSVLLIITIIMRKDGIKKELFCKQLTSSKTH